MKQTIITAMLALVVVAGGKQETKEQEQVFVPVVNDTIDFVIEGTANERADTFYIAEHPYSETVKYPIRNGHFCITIREPLHKFLMIADGAGGWMEIVVDSLPAYIAVDFCTNTVTEGSSLNKRFNHYMLIRDSIEQQMGMHFKDEDCTIYNSLEQQWKEIVWKGVIDNYDNVIPVYCLYLLHETGMLTPEQLKECMKEEYAFAHHPDMEMMWKYYWEMLKRLSCQNSAKKN